MSQHIPEPMLKLLRGVCEIQWQKLIEEWPLEAAYLKGLALSARALLAKVEGT